MWHPWSWQETPVPGGVYGITYEGFAHKALKPLAIIGLPIRKSVVYLWLDSRPEQVEMVTVNGVSVERYEVMDARCITPYANANSWVIVVDMPNALPDATRASLVVDGRKILLTARKGKTSIYEEYRSNRWFACDIYWEPIKVKARYPTRTRITTEDTARVFIPEWANYTTLQMTSKGQRSVSLKLE